MKSFSLKYANRMQALFAAIVFMSVAIGVSSFAPSLEGHVVDVVNGLAGTSFEIVPNGYVATASIAGLFMLPIMRDAGAPGGDGGDGGDTFKEKTVEEISKLDDEEVVKYYRDLNVSNRKKLQEAIDSKASKDDIDKLKTEIIEANDKKFDAFEKALIEQGKAMTIISKTGESKTSLRLFKEQVTIALTDNLEKLKALKGDDALTSAFSFKVAGTMLTSTNVSGGNVPLEEREAGINGIARRRTFMFDLVARATTDSTTISWVEKQNVDGSAGGTTEGATKNQIDFDLVVVKESIKKRTAYIKVSDEMIDDIPFMASEINNELLEVVALDADSQIFGGDGIGNNLNGVVTQATPFAAGVHALAVEAANEVDVLVAGIDQVEVANFMPNFIVLHPSDVAKMLLIKASDNNYIERLIFVNGTLSLDGIPIIKNTGVPSGDFLIGDFTKAGLFEKEGLNVQIGLDGNDFTKNLRTVRAEWRALLRIKGNDTPAFVTGTFATAKAALETI